MICSRDQSFCNNDCPRFGAALVGGIALLSTIVGGELDFPGDSAPVTMSVGGPGRLVDCQKCPECGFSRRNHDD